MTILQLDVFSREEQPNYEEYSKCKSALGPTRLTRLMKSRSSNPNTNYGRNRRMSQNVSHDAFIDAPSNSDP